MDCQKKEIEESWGRRLSLCSIVNSLHRENILG
ncbi:hypothetical protein CEXT_189441, partial [Caerostris extrusa]